MPFGRRANVHTGGGVASSNWRYLTEADRTGPRKDSMMVTSTEDAKARFSLTTADLTHIQGFRQPGIRSTRTGYFVEDLTAAAIAKFGQEHFDKHVPEGKELSGVAAREREVAAQKLRDVQQLELDKRPYAVVPPERLCNLTMEKLRGILARCEGGMLPPPCASKDQFIQRILKAGYSMEVEEVVMAREKAKHEAERAASEATIAKRKAEEAAKASAAAAAKAERARKFAVGELSVDVLTLAEVQEQLRLRGVPAKELHAKKAELVERLKTACAKRKAVDAVDENTADSAENAAKMQRASD